jgi:hypothetical protein
LRVRLALPGFRVSSYVAIPRSAPTFSSQKRISISRYIAAAVVRCCSAFDPSRIARREYLGLEA